MGDTSIEWTQRPGTRGRSWNPTQGCQIISEGCRNCYAMKMARRFAGPGGWAEGLVNTKTGKWTGETKFAEHKLAEPLSWREPSTVFVDSMSDLYYGRTNEQIAAVYGVMAACPQHTFIILTKRPREALEWNRWTSGVSRSQTTYDCTWFNHLASKHGADGESWLRHCRDTEDLHAPWPLPNVWLGVSVENQAAADERIPLLLETRSALRFLSCEPLLGAVELTRRGANWLRVSMRDEQLPEYDVNAIAWVIVGCESGPGMRPCATSWIHSLRDQCAAEHVPFFLKQAHPATWVAGEAPPPVRRDVRDPVISAGALSRLKPRGVITLPYLDGVQHAEFPR